MQAGSWDLGSWKQQQPAGLVPPSPCSSLPAWCSLLPASACWPGAACTLQQPAGLLLLAQLSGSAQLTAHKVGLAALAARHAHQPAGRAAGHYSVGRLA